jgi:hypothetical protein
MIFIRPITDIIVVHCRNYMLWKIIVDNVERWKNVRRPGIEPGSQEWESCIKGFQHY